MVRTYLKNEEIRQTNNRIDDRRIYRASIIKTIFPHWNINRKRLSLYTGINKLYNYKNKRLFQFFSFYADHSNTIINNLRNEYGRGSDFIGGIDEFNIVEQRSQIRNI
ncbi:MAG TPA: hypothetical protein VIY08_07605, partial [Candidatus Nitrosocosmicus sp.]